MKKILYFLFIAVSAVALTNCKGKDAPGRAEVKVLDAEGVSQKGVHVTLFCTQPNCIVKTTGLTNSLGVYVEEFDLPAVLRVRAVRYDSTISYQGLPPNQIEVVSVDSLCGEGFITIANNEVASEVITILDCR
jgi:hypothetical protein